MKNQNKHSKPYSGRVSGFFYRMRSSYLDLRIFVLEMKLLSRTPLWGGLYIAHGIAIKTIRESNYDKKCWIENLQELIHTYDEKKRSNIEDKSIYQSL